MKLLVTGGCGFIGANFIHYVLSDSSTGVSNVINVDALSYAGNPDNLQLWANDSRYCFYHADIADSGQLDQILLKHSPDAILNFAAESHVDRSIDSPEPFFQTNVIGTLRLLESFRRYFNKQSTTRREDLRFLQVSTDEVFGSLNPGDPPFRETTPFAPNSPYSASKASADHIVRAAFHTYQLPVLTTHCSNNYGPYQFPEKLIPLMILNALEGKDLPIYGNGQNIRDWLYVKDHCRALWTVLERGKIGDTYTIGGNNEKTNIQIVDTVCTLLEKAKPSPRGRPYHDLKKFVADRPGHDQRYAIDNSKITQELGWAPQESFSSGLKKTVDWYLGNLPWCEKITSEKYQRQRLGQ